jgi:hypothetical protein
MHTQMHAMGIQVQEWLGNNTGCSIEFVEPPSSTDQKSKYINAVDADSNAYETLQLDAAEEDRHSTSLDEMEAPLVNDGAPYDDIERGLGGRAQLAKRIHIVNYSTWFACTFRVPNRIESFFASSHQSLC